MPANPVCIAEIRKIIDIIFENHDIRLSVLKGDPKNIRVDFESDEKRSLSSLRFHVKTWDELYPEILRNCTERAFSFFDISSFGVSGLDFKNKVFGVANKIGFNKFDPNSPNYNVANFAVLKKNFKPEDGAYTQDEHEKGLMLLSKDIACVITKVLLEYYLGGSFKRASEYDFSFSMDETSNVGGLKYFKAKYKELSESKPELFSGAFAVMDDEVSSFNREQGDSFLAARRSSEIERSVDKRLAFNRFNASFNAGVGSFDIVDQFSKSINEYLHKRFNTKDDDLQGVSALKNRHLARYERQINPDDLSKFMSFDEESILSITQNYLKLVQDYTRLEEAVAELEKFLSASDEISEVPESLGLLPRSIGSLQAAGSPISTRGSKAKHWLSGLSLRKRPSAKKLVDTAADTSVNYHRLSEDDLGGGAEAGRSDSRNSMLSLFSNDDFYVDMSAGSIQSEPLMARATEPAARRGFATTCKDLKDLIGKMNCLKSRRRAAISSADLSDDLGDSDFEQEY